MQIRLEATSVGIRPEMAVEWTGIEKSILNFFHAYLVPRQLVNNGYTTVHLPPVFPPPLTSFTVPKA